ncbi:hypothetical protein NDU88_009086 [Pleurodeles waltl]|uniref:Uncharacterized protein n=1 Tax=Pleurodeles waltl TaxID=8319 RepID=A0AAV7P179_PLEWA|nr:hypothetical protein NDU88_009086 [Pleurodeles waltl]
MDTSRQRGIALLDTDSTWNHEITATPPTLMQLVQGTNERLYLMSNIPTQESTAQHVEVVDKRQIKKTATVDIQVGSHSMRFVLDSGATCNIMCVSEYEKMIHKPLLLPSSVVVLTWGARQPVLNMGKFVETLTYNNMSVQEEVHVLRGDVPAPFLLSNIKAQ